jgi:catechol 2,3-dioxygenase-like lactoylglutathione lyase family enzyme
VVGLDHLVLTVQDLSTTISFYTKVLGMSVVKFGPEGSRTALQFGDQKINLHLKGKEFKPHAANPTNGSGDFCFVTQTPLSKWEEHLVSLKVEIEEGPVPRTGAKGPMTSIYLRDPDFNLLEIAFYGQKKDKDVLSF